MQGRASFILLGVLAASAHPASAEGPGIDPGQGAAPTRIKLIATLGHLPKAPPCEGRVSRVVARHRVERVLGGKYTEPTILVVHRCPEFARGPSRYGKGDAGPLRPGHVHLLTLERLAEVPAGAVDPFGDDPRPRYDPLRADRTTWPPRIVVVATGGAGTNHKLAFDAGQVVIGRAADVDVRLSDPGVALRHLELSVQGEALEARDLGSASGSLVNGKPLSERRSVTFEDRIQVGTYTIRAALFLDVRDEE